MRKHTKEFKSSISTFGRELDSKINVIGTNLVLGKEDLYSVKPITNATLLKTVMKEVDFESKQQIGVGQEINVKSGVKVGNEYEYIDYGNYFVYKSEYRAETDSYSHICYDRMLNTMIDYLSLDITYPINLREYINAIATKCGLDFANKNDEFPNYNTAINEDHFSNGNYTFRDVLDYIAQLVGGWFCINDNDELEIRYPELARNYDKVSGESISFISNAEDEINTITLDGRSTQETRSGKNLFDLKDGTYSHNGITAIVSNGVITLNGTATANSFVSIPVSTNYNINNGETITVSLNNATANNYCSLRIDSPGSYDTNAKLVNNSRTMTISTTLLSSSITIRTGSGGSYTNYSIKPQLEKGSTATDWEQFGAMPSPDYPSEVECVRGKNLFDENNLNFFTTANGKIEINNHVITMTALKTVSSNDLFVIGKIDDSLLINGESYTISSINVSGMAQSFRLQLRNKDGSYVAGMPASATITYDDAYGLYVINNPFSTSGSTVIPAGTVAVVKNIKVEKGQPVATDYVPYNNIQIKNTGKNLLPNKINITSKSGVEIKVNNDGSTTLKGTATSDIYLTLNQFNIGELKDTYTLSGASSINIQLAIFSFDKNNVQQTERYFDIGNTRTFNIINNYSYRVQILIRNGTVLDDTIYAQLEKGAVATPYEPYKSQTLNIDLQDNELCSIGDAKDELVIKDGRAKIIKKVGKRENNVVSNVTNTYTNIKYYQIAKPTDYERYNKYNYADDTLFTHASTKNTTTTWNSEININKMVGVPSRLYFWIGFPVGTTLEQARVLLSNNCLYYVLATPTEIDLGKVDTLNTYNGVNNISLNATLNTNMSITYTNDFEELDKHFLKDVNVSFMKKYGAINSVVFSRGGGTDNIYRKDNASINKNGLTEIKIADNPFLEGDDRENFIQPLFDKINGLEFYLMDVNSTGIMYLELGDLYYFNMIEDKPSLKSGLVKSGLRKAQGSSGGKFLCLLMNNEVKITQGLEESIYTDEPEITETDYKTASITDTSIKNAIIQTKKNSAEILLKVNSDEVVSAINLSPEKIKISSAKLDIDAIATFTNSKLAEAGSTVINGANITTGTLSANRISGGTISASTIDLKGTVLTPTSSSIGGLNVESGIISNDRMGLDTVNGIVKVFNANGGSMILSNAARLSATAGIGLTSNSTGVVPAPTTNLDLKACSGAEAYLGSMINADGTGERSGITCSNGLLSFRSTGYCTYNGTTVFGSSSKATKENIEDLSQEQKEEVYELIKNIPTKQYDYKKEYGKPFNYGFIIEDIENTKLKELLHITQAENNKDIKMYSTEDLVRLQLIVIQELMKKVETLEKKESENNAEN